MIPARHIGLGIALVAAAALAWWGPVEPDEVAQHEGRAEPADERLAIRAPGGPARAVSAAAGDVTVESIRPRKAPPPLPEDPTSVGGPFAARTWDPPPVVVAPAPPPPPMAPPLPFTVIGKKLDAGGWEVYLAQGDQVHVVRPETVIDGTYRVGSIRPPTMSLTYLPLQQVQHLSIGAPE